MDVPSGCADTSEAIWEPIIWSFKALYMGTKPTLDRNGFAWPAGSEAARVAGEPLFQTGEFMVLWTMSGDREFYQRYFKHPAPNANRGPCIFCATSTAAGPANFRNFQASATWRQTIIAPAQASPSLPECRSPSGVEKFPPSCFQYHRLFFAFGFAR